jgi:hypothetical protein
MSSQYDLEAMVNKKAASDANFKKEFLADPRSALNKQGLQIPADVKISAHEAGGKIVVTLPEDAKSGALSDAALEQVAGGSCHHYAWTASCSGSTGWTMIC